MGDAVVSGPGRSETGGDEFDFLDRREPGGGSQGGERSAREGESRGPGPRRRRRQKTGKRSNPEYTQISAWVRKQTRNDFEVAKAQEASERGERREFSAIVDSLLEFYATEGDPWEILGGEGRR